jgi:hypothetical protein
MHNLRLHSYTRVQTEGISDSIISREQSGVSLNRNSSQSPVFTSRLAWP